MKKRFVKNRIMLTLTACTLAFSAVSFPVYATEPDELPAIERSGGEDHLYTAPVNPRWDDQFPGRVYFEATDPESGYLVIQMFINGEPVAYGTAILPSNGAKTYSYNFSDKFLVSGRYTFRVKHTYDKEDINVAYGAVSEESPAFDYVLPTEKIKAPTNIRWSTSKKGVAEWNAVDHAGLYQVHLEVVNEEKTIDKFVDAPATSCDFSDVISQNPYSKFTFCVYAWSSDITKWGNTITPSALSDEYYPFLIRKQKIESFVKRLYKVALNREADAEGLDTWSSQLATGEKNAVDIVKGVLCSDEYLGKDKENGDMVTDCYHAMLDREPDLEGYKSWVSKLDAGMSINAIFAGFVGSQEFKNLCDQYEISPGKYPVTEERDKNAGVTMFVSRLYTEALGRSYDVEGLNNWCGKINANSSKNNILKVSTDGFFHSAEFMGKDLSDAEFVVVCYRTFLGRDFDLEGLTMWVGQLTSGAKTRDQVMEGFAYSQEFTNIMASFGL